MLIKKFKKPFFKNGPDAIHIPRYKFNIATSSIITFLHNLFFPQLREPTSINKPTGEVLELFESKYDSFNNFKSRFTGEAMGIQGSGWIYIDTKGDIKTIQNHKMVDNVAMIIDWWEHAWALDYQHDKAKYLKNIWKIINWDIVNERINGNSKQEV